MTKILKLEAKGFKSFAEKTEIVFGDDFNVILGPNGSGKSNCFDALCFVLGKSGAKGLRAEKSANLIYNGGKQKTPAKQGEVSIFLDNAEGTFPVKEKVVKITRIIKPSGISIYKINDEKHTRDQVLELLGSASIDPNGYNIILQGDIVRLVEMSPVERRGIIEEIAGISVYEDKKVKAQRELDKIETNLNDASIILSEREIYLKELKKERDQAVTYKELQTRVKSLKATIINLDITDKKTEIDTLNESNSSFKEKITAIQSEIDALKKETQDLKSSINDINKEVEEQGEKQQVALHKEVEMLKVTVATQEANVGGFTNELNRVKNQKKQYEDSLKSVLAKSSSFEQEIKDAQNKLSQNQKLKAELLAKIDAFKKKNKLDDATEIDAQIDELDKKAEEIEKELMNSRGEQQELIREKDRLELQISQADDKIEKVLNVSKENKAELDLLKDKKKLFKEATNELQKSLTKDASYVSQISNARGKLQTAQEELAKLRVRQASISEIGSGAVKEILKNKDRFGGVYGTVAELGSVDSKYSTALDTAAGNRLQSVVVQDDKVAAACIKYLRDNRLGIATFLPLNKIKGATKAEIDNVNGVIGSAIDLVKFDPKFKPVFKYIFGSTVVVENIDVARRIGIGKAKMVTLQGDLAEVSGAMKGGFVKRRPGAGFQEDKVNDSANKYEKQVNDSQMMLTNLESERAKNLELIDRLREHKAQLEGEIIKKEKSLHLESDDLEISQKLKKEFEAKLEEVEEKLATSSVLAKNRELVNIKIEKQKLKSQIMDMKNPTKLAELNTLTEKVDSLKTEIIKLESEIETKQKQVDESYKDDKAQAQKLVDEQEKEQEHLEKKISDAKETIANAKVELKEKEAAEAEFYKAFKKQFAMRKKLEEALKKSEEKTIKKEEEIRTYEHKNTAISLDLARLTAELRGFEEELKQYEGVEILNDTDKAELKKEAWSADSKLSRIGNVNMKALEVYDRVQEEFDKLLAKKDVLISEREKILLMINEIESKKTELFNRVFTVINDNFKRIFQILSTKGDAGMELENPKSPFDGGVSIKVKLKGTKFMDIRSLSGGEKTLTALAFIFAVQEHNPASFYVFDEVDAALDKRNSEKLANLIKSYADRAQYVVVSHNDGVIGQADNLYGVSMNEHGISKVVSLKI